jgi:hypothetical protein
MATRFLRTSEHEEAVRSLEWAEIQARGLSADPYLWKWVFIALHNAAQGFMVLALWNGNGLLALRPRVAEKWLKAYESGGQFPTEKLDEFLSLYAKVKDRFNFNTIGAGPFPSNESIDASFQRLNEIRNDFTHFTPKGWSLELAGLPNICLDVLLLIEHFGWETTAVLWHLRSHPVRAKRSLKRLRRTLQSLGVQGGA